MLVALPRLVVPTFVVLVALCPSASAQHDLPTVPPPPPVEQRSAAPALSTTPPSSQSDLERARALFAEGLGFVAQEDWHNAADRFNQVRAIRSSPVVSYNLASALAELGQRVESSKLLMQVLGDSQADVDTRRAAQLLLTKIEPQIGALSIRVYGNSEDCRFSLDGQPIEVTSGALSLLVDLGDHAINVERDGATILSPHVTIGGTFPMQAQLALEIPPRPRPQLTPVTLPPPRREFSLQLSPPREQPRDDDDSLLEQWWLWAGAGAILAGAVVTTVVLASDSDPQPIAGNTDPPVIHTRVVMGTRP